MSSKTKLIQSDVMNINIIIFSNIYSIFNKDEQTTNNMLYIILVSIETEVKEG